MSRKEYRLNPHLSARQLYDMCQDPDWWPRLDLIYAHPHAYEDLREWLEQAQSMGSIELMPPAPEPPQEEHASLADRLLAPRRLPSPPDMDDMEGESDEMVIAATMPIPTHEPDAGTTAVPAMPDQLTQPQSADPDEESEEWDEFDTMQTARERSPHSKAIVIAAGVALAIVAAWSLTALLRPHDSASAPASAAGVTASPDSGGDGPSARERCNQARQSVQDAADRWNLAQAKGQSLLAQTKTADVADAAVIDELTQALQGGGGITPACPTTEGKDMDTAIETNTLSAKHLKQELDRLDKAVAAVQASRDRKTLADAETLYKRSNGKVTDDKTRQELKKQIDGKDLTALPATMQKVRASMHEWTKQQNERKAQQEEQARQAQAQREAQEVQQQAQAQTQQQQQQQAIPSPTPVQPTQPQPQAPSEEKPNWSVPEPGGDGTLGERDPGL